MNSIHIGVKCHEWAGKKMNGIAAGEVSQSIEGLASNHNASDIINATIEAERRPAALLETQQVQKTWEIYTFTVSYEDILTVTVGGGQSYNHFSIG